MNDAISIVSRGGKVCFFLNVELDQSDVEQLKDFASAQGISVSELATRIIKVECGNKLDERPE